MSFLKLNLIYILIINCFNISLLKYPIYKDIEKSEKGEITSKIIKSKEDYFNYILNNNYVISLINFSSFEKYSEYIKKFDILSSYKILNKWNFLKIICEEPNDLCQLYEKDSRNSPLIKIYVKYIEIKTMNLLLDFELNQLIEYLLKFSTNPIIDINDNKTNEFYDKYDDYSPLVLYDKDNSEFISCITMLAKKKYYQYFYFGAMPININKEKIEIIIFNKKHLPLFFTWERECDDLDAFLSQNIYPLINNVDKPLIYQLNLIPKVLVILIGNISKNDKINKFINNNYQKISYNFRNLVFGIIDYSKDKYFINQYNININNDNNIQIMIYNFYENIYYIHPLLFNIESQNEKEIYQNINDICRDLEYLSFTSGSLFKDLIRKIGIYKIINKLKKNLKGFGVLISFIILVLVYYFFFNKKTGTENKKPKKD